MRKIKDTLTLVKDGVCEYKIRIATPMEPVSNELEVAQAIARLIEAATGVLPEIDEAKPDNWQYHEILVGKTIREDDNLKIDRDGMEQDACTVCRRVSNRLCRAGGAAGHRDAETDVQAARKPKTLLHMGRGAAVFRVLYADAAHRISRFVHL